MWLVSNFVHLFQILLLWMWFIYIVLAEVKPHVYDFSPLNKGRWEGAVGLPYLGVIMVAPLTVGELMPERGLDKDWEPQVLPWVSWASAWSQLHLEH